MKKPAPVTPAQARSFGKDAALSGRAKETCPFLAGPERQAWMDGWRKGAKQLPGTRVDLSAKLEPTPAPAVEVKAEPVLAPAAPVEAPAPAPPVTPEKPAKVSAKKAPVGAGNPFKEGTVAAAITAKLLLGGSYDLQALFAGVQSKCPAGILGDLKRKGLPLVRTEAGQYQFATKGGK